MTKQRHITNPTGIKDIPKGRIAVTGHRDSNGVLEEISIDQLDLTDLDLPHDARVRLVGKARNTEQLFDLGTASKLNLLKNVKLDQIDKSYPLHLRLFVFDPQTNAILASCERLSIDATSEGTTKSLLPVEPYELGEVLWKVKTGGGDRPLLLVNDNPSIGMLQKIKTDPLVQALVLPQAIEIVLRYLVRCSGDDDDEDSWQNRWKIFLKRMGAELPDTEIDDSEGDDKISELALQVSSNLKFATNFLRSVAEPSE
jgi:hypothetical protein